MGKFSGPLAPLFCDFAGVAAGQRVLDVGCGPGALVAELVRRVGRGERRGRRPRDAVRRGRARAESRSRHPRGVGGAAAVRRRRVRRVARATRRPLHGRSGRRARRRCARVTRPGGVVAACVWDHAGGQGPLSPFWDAVHALDPDAPDESQLAGAREGHLTELFGRRGVARRARVVARSHGASRQLRRMVGPVHARSRARRRLSHRSRRRAAGWRFASAAGRRSAPDRSSSPPAPGLRAALA